MKTTLLAFLSMLIFSISVFANPYPATLDNGNLVLVDAGLGVGQYAVRPSVKADSYNPPHYQLTIDVVSVNFSDNYWQQYGTYVGSPYHYGKTYRHRFSYTWTNKMLSYERGNQWFVWDIYRDHSHADGEPLIPNAAEVAFVTAYNMRFFDSTMKYSPLLKSYSRVIDDSLYRALRI